MENQFVRFGVRTIARSGVVPVVEGMEAHRKNLLRILVYHRIADPAADAGQLDPSLVSATPAQFEQQMRFLKHNYHLVSIQELLQAVEQGKRLPPKSVMVTFDDGYRGFKDAAWPILARHQVPALMFLATGFLEPENQLFWWDRLYQGIFKTNRSSLSLPGVGEFPLGGQSQRWQTFNQLKKVISTQDNCNAAGVVSQALEDLDVQADTAGFVLNWSDVRQLSQEGCFFAAHTRTHPILARISVQDAFEQICLSQEDIQREIGTSLPVVAYPSGHTQDCSLTLNEFLGRAGFRLGMGSIPGINVLPREDLLMLKRIGLSPRLNLPEFRMVLTGMYHFYATLLVRLLHKDL